MWRNSLDDPALAVRRYREALALGATRSLPEIFSTAGARFTFDEADLSVLVAAVEERMEELRQHFPATV